MRFAFILLFIKLGSNKLFAQDVDYKAYSLFVYNFMKYVEWPEANSKNEFVVCIFGDSPIQKELQTLAASGKKVKGKTIVVKTITKPEEANECQLLYVAPSKSSAMKTINALYKDKPILIVGEREGLAKKGAALSFVTLEDDALKFDINKKEIAEHQLKISSSLVSLGIVVN